MEIVDRGHEPKKLVMDPKSVLFVNFISVFAFRVTFNVGNKD
jgi:hypothetical protein